MAAAKIAARDGRRRELAEFLRARRERIGPSDVGLAPGPRRRTPGLRREEVANLAGVGLTWYTWLEQGRPIRASTQVLDAIARTLQLGPAEHKHLLSLAAAEVGVSNVDVTFEPPAEVLEMLDALDPIPAVLASSRYDGLAVNAAYDDLVRDWHEAPCRHFNLLWCTVTDPVNARTRLVNYDTEIPWMVARLRANMADHLGDPAWVTFVEELSEASPEFRDLWARHEVAGVESRTKVFSDPVAGLLTFTTTSLGVTARPEMSLIVYTPADDATRERLPLTRR